MGLILAYVVAIGTVIFALLIIGGNSAMVAPSMTSRSPVPTLVIGLGIAGVLALTHYYPIHW